MFLIFIKAAGASAADNLKNLTKQLDQRKVMIIINDKNKNNRCTRPCN